MNRVRRAGVEDAVMKWQFEFNAYGLEGRGGEGRVLYSDSN